MVSQSISRAPPLQIQAFYKGPDGMGNFKKLVDFVS